MMTTILSLSNFVLSFVLKLIERIFNFKTNYIHYAIRAYIRDGNPLIVEIGAHNGEDTLLFANHYSSAKLFCFEPDPRLTPSLRDKFKSYPNIIFAPQAIY